MQGVEMEELNEPRRRSFAPVLFAIVAGFALVGLELYDEPDASLPTLIVELAKPLLTVVLAVCVLSWLRVDPRT
jgi:hypothetical protein